MASHLIQEKRKIRACASKDIRRAAKKLLLEHSQAQHSSDEDNAERQRSKEERRKLRERFGEHVPRGWKLSDVGVRGTPFCAGPRPFDKNICTNWAKYIVTLKSRRVRDSRFKLYIYLDWEEISNEDMTLVTPEALRVVAKHFYWDTTHAEGEQLFRATRKIALRAFTDLAEQMCVMGLDFAAVFDVVRPRN